MSAPHVASRRLLKRAIEGKTRGCICGRRDTIALWPRRLFLEYRAVRRIPGCSYSVRRKLVRLRTHGVCSLFLFSFRSLLFTGEKPESAHRSGHLLNACFRIALPISAVL